MKKILVSLIILFIAMEFLGWWAKERSGGDVKEAKQQVNNESVQSKSVEAKQNADTKLAKSDEQMSGKTRETQVTSNSNNLAAENVNDSGFPPPTVETVDGVAQRTIHMGARQWAWDPAQLKVNYGEKVILIMHNADVPHSLSIPELNVKQTIPEEGAIIKFVASKRGTFEFACDNPCGSGHAKMRGNITVL